MNSTSAFDCNDIGITSVERATVYLQELEARACGDKV